MEKETLNQLLERYLRDECSPEEIRLVHDWYNSFEQDENPVELLPGGHREALRYRLLMRVKGSINIPVAEREPRRRPLVRSMGYALAGVAAMLLIVLGITFVYRAGSEKQLAETLEMVAVNNTPGIQRKVLPDGTIVWLNPRSRISYPRKFAAARRVVRMSGEAFFEVTHAPARPFIIYSGDIETTVWGTSFLIRAYQNTPAEVSVATGKVSVKPVAGNQPVVMLLPRQNAIYNKNSKQLTKRVETRTAFLKMWEKASLSFDNASLASVIANLNSRFGVQISCTDPALLSYTLKADFSNQNLPSILEMLERSLDIHYEINDGRIFLTSIKRTF